jgi:Zn-finger nucleic acid-binding protein
VSVRLVACKVCHAQYDVTHVVDKVFTCRCGAEVANRKLTAVDADIHRCGSCGALVTASAEACDFCGSKIVRDTWKLSLICPECYGRNEETARFCTACGVPFRPEPIGQTIDELPCPACGCLMPGRWIDDVGVNECGECNGLWVPGDRFEDLINRAIEARKNADPHQLGTLKPRRAGGNPIGRAVEYRKCPICDGYMQRRNFRRKSGVIIDRCRDHGTWLDADELEQIAGFILNGGLARAQEAAKRDGETAGMGDEAADRSARAAADFQRILMEHGEGERMPTPLDDFGDWLDQLISVGVFGFWARRARR